MEKPNIVVTGSPRSGTTALTVVLNKSFFLHIYDEMGLYKPSGLRDRLGNLVKLEHEWIARYNDCIKTPIHKLLASKGTEDALQSSIIDQTKYPIIGDKFHSDYLSHVPEITKKHNPLWIVCIRDPRAVIASQLRKDHFDSEYWKIKDPYKGGDIWLKSMEAWVKYRDEIPEQNKVEVRYETASSNISFSINEILSKLTIDVSDSKLKEMCETYIPTNVSSWETELNDFEIPEKFKPTMAALGYL